MNQLPSEKTCQTIHKQLVEDLGDNKLQLAVIHGSRAYGFATPTSDVDIFFIYSKPKEKYLSIYKGKDAKTLTYRLDGLDINCHGWELGKYLQAVQKSNPTVREIVQCPLLVRGLNMETNRTVVELIWQTTNLNHLLNSYIGQYFSYDKRGVDGDLKTHIHKTRLCLMIDWIMEMREYPPVDINILVEAASEELKSEVLKEVKARQNGQIVGNSPILTAFHNEILCTSKDWKASTPTHIDNKVFDQLFLQLI